MFYPHPGPALPVWKVVGAVVVLVCISAGALACWRRCPYLLVGWLWYLGMLVPVIGLVQVGVQAMADRYTYLPQIGLYIALAWAVADAVPVLALSSLGVRRRVGAGAGGSDGLCMASDVVLAGQRDSLDPRPGLYRQKLAGPQQPVACNNFGMVLADRGRFDEAIACFEKALEIKPDFAEAYFNLGLVLARHGQIDKAIAHYHKALELKPDCAEAHYNLGLALAGRGQVDEAMACFRKALEIKPELRGGPLQPGRGSGSAEKSTRQLFSFSRRCRSNPMMLRPIKTLVLPWRAAAGSMRRRRIIRRRWKSSPTSPRPTTTSPYS